VCVAVQTLIPLSINNISCCASGILAHLLTSRSSLKFKIILFFIEQISGYTV
jgi:hypothetical protein